MTKIYPVFKINEKIYPVILIIGKEDYLVFAECLIKDFCCTKTNIQHDNTLISRQIPCNFVIFMNRFALTMLCDKSKICAVFK